MTTQTIRMLVAGTAAALLTTSQFAAAQAPAPYTVNQEMIQAAQKEGKIIVYTSIDLRVAQQLAQRFEAKYPKIKVEMNVSGSERNFQRLNQEYNSGIHGVDVIDSPDVFHFAYMKRKGWLKAAVPEDLVAWPEADRDPDGYFAADRATITLMAYNTKLVKPEEAPTSYGDLLKPQWKGKIIKADPHYSGTIMVHTYNLSKALGWPYFEKLAQQGVMQVMSATETPTKVAQGERAVMADGTEYNVILLREKGAPIQEIYATEGSPIIAANAGILDKAPHPNAALLFYHYLFSKDGQQVLVNAGKMRSFHPDIDEGNMKPLAEIKLLQSSAAEIEKNFESTKANYDKSFTSN